MNRNYDFITFISKYLYFKKAQSSQFADIIKIATTFIYTTLKDTTVVKIIRNYVWCGVVRCGVCVCVCVCVCVILIDREAFFRLQDV